ncbi:TetR/AcrR family transcriptional regulator [Amycolatopsis sp. WAC 01416]|uniref:TetR/AcrR family transcriptional regulator n=1 Tax=Amycolatopsis sp. WAC 01416 TaxID=2203196 RepID=UPI000F7937C7|nr:TetR/AcrR family transcriptional regulator [Amycolatopsis sp. WAC 01416]RSN34545.1 TetR/AcrR family transcriptional regulator [Amycolatopsis sp. WAC 01416]
MATPKATARTPGRRLQAEAKQAAILDAAEALFVSDGYELTSVDAISARAGVSKRTVYDHFGDKQTLFRSVLGRANDAVVATVHKAIDEELTDDRDIRAALLGFARRVTTGMFPTSDYATFRRLSSQAPVAPRLPEAARDQPERMMEERFAKFAADGRLRPADPRRAMQHFVALTMRLVLDVVNDDLAGTVGKSEILAILDDGVDVFLRAYG